MLKMGPCFTKAYTYTHRYTQLFSFFYMHPKNCEIDGIPYHNASFFQSANFLMCNG